jgi:hypothetical protein
LTKAAGTTRATDDEEAEMASKTDFTSEEWTLLLRAPGWVSIAVAAASPSGPIGIVKEMFAAGKVLAQAKAGGQNSLVEAVVADLATSAGRQQAQPSEASGKSPSEIRGVSVDALKRVASLVDAKAGADAAGFKRWLASVAGNVAQAAKEGGFLGIGGTLVDEEETRALADIGNALGVTVG